VLEIAIVVLLVVINGVFALSELAIVSARRARLQAMAAAGKRGAARALALAADPGRFLSTVQIGITAVGLIAGAYSGATLSLALDEYLEELGVPDVAVQVIQHIGPGYVIGFAVLVLMAYAVCLALGSACVRFAFARR
jgi:putative hemolysin